MLLSPSDEDDSDATLQPLTAPLKPSLQPLTPLSVAEKPPCSSSAIEILSPTFSSSDSGSEPSSPLSPTYQTELSWYRRLYSHVCSFIAPFKARFFPRTPADLPSLPPPQASPTTSGFISPSILKQPPPPPIMVPPPPKDLHLLEYFPLLSPSVSGLWKRRRTSSTPKRPNSASSTSSSSSTRTEQVFSPKESNWPPPLESPCTPWSDKGEEEDEKDGEYIRV